MELGTAVALTLNLLNEHGLIEQGWTVKLTRGSARLGVCYWNKKRIMLARHHVINGTDVEIIDTIRHEVAHALAGPLAKHGIEWKRWAIRLGCRPRSHTRVTYQMPYKFVLHCPCCNKDIQKRRVKVSMRRLQILFHPACGHDSLGKLLLRRYVNVG